MTREETRDTLKGQGGFLDRLLKKKTKTKAALSSKNREKIVCLWEIKKKKGDGKGTWFSQER